MTTPENQNPKWEPVYAVSRDWTSEEVTEAAAYVKQERPDVWAELLELERTTGDLRESDAADIEMGLLGYLHPECDLSQLGQLMEKLRDKRLTELKLNF